MQYRNRRVAFLHRTHYWDQFVEASAQRAKLQFGAEDFFVLADHTKTRFAAPGFNTVGFSLEDCRIQGLYVDPLDSTPMWTNGDYSWYQARAQLPDYDLYVASEFDVWFNIDFSRLLDAVIDYQLDVLVTSYEESATTWHHYWSSRAYWQPVCAMLTVFGVYSGAWLDHMFQKRLEMSERALQETLPGWPFVESFLGSESRRIGSRVGLLNNWFDVSNCRYAPELPSSMIPNMRENTILHPIKKF
jgi:hypothetical protein